MAKKAQKTKVKTCVKCQCSTCKQVANARVNTPHFSCKGIDLSIIAQLPAKYKGLINPYRLGTWLVFVAKESPLLETLEESKVA